MKKIILLCVALLLTSCSVAQAQEVTSFAWDAVTTSIDGSSVAEPVVYRIYCDPSPMVDVGEVLTVPISIAGADGNYACTMTAYTSISGSESPHSNTVTVVKQNGRYYTGGTLNAPSNFRTE